MEPARWSWRGKALRVAGLFGLLGLLTTYVQPGPAAAPLGPGQVALAAMPIPFDARAPNRRREGRLLFLGGWHLGAADPRFGGISAMHVGEQEVLAISDAGSLLRFRRPDRDGADWVAVRPIPRGPGTGARKSDRDTESLVVHGRRAWIGFEGRNQVWRYALPDFLFEAAAAPAAMKGWSTNSGSEAMVRLPDGRFIVFAEGPVRGDGTSAALLFAGDPALAATGATDLRYRPPSGYRITDATVLPDGRLLLLNRRFTLWDGVSAKLVLAPPLKQGAPIAGEEIATLRPPLAVDNMEAVSARREEGQIVLWLASDDNFSPLQRTLLLKFALVP